MTNPHYDENYFEWQKEIGEFAGKNNKKLFESFINRTDNVIEFGCGGAYLLSNLNCLNKIGVEINSAARRMAKSNGVFTVTNANDIADGWADVVISDCALEHADCPLIEIITLKKKLRKEGLAVFVIPHEYTIPYSKDDINKHLYTWSESCAGNMFERAGYTIMSIETIRSKWPPHYKFIRETFGEKIFEITCMAYSIWNPSIRLIRVVARKDMVGE